MSIAVVDGDDELRASIVELLRAHGHRVVGLVNSPALEALHASAEEAPANLFVINLSLLGEGGLGEQGQPRSPHRAAAPQARRGERRQRGDQGRAWIRLSAWHPVPHQGGGLQVAGQRLSTKPSSKLALRWEAVEGLAARMRRHLRPLYEALEPTGVEPDNPWLAALTWMKGVFAKQQRLSQRPAEECHEQTVPGRLRPHLLTLDTDGKPTGVQADRYEFWIYRQLRKCLKSGEIYLDDSLQHRHLSAELVSADKQAQALEQMDIPWVRRPLDEQLSNLCAELHEQWLAFDRELREGKLKHLDYDEGASTLTWRRPRAEKDAAQQDAFYEQRPSAMWPMSSVS